MYTSLGPGTVKSHDFKNVTLIVILIQTFMKLVADMFKSSPKACLILFS